MRTTNNNSNCGPYTTANLAEMKYMYGSLSCQIAAHIPSVLRNKALDILHRKGSSLQDFIRIQLHRLVEINSFPEPQEEQPKPEPNRQRV